jgi:hypothetical protein
MRDGYRCPVTGLYDIEAVRSGLLELPEGAHGARTHAAHIIPESINTNINSNPAKVWGILTFHDLHLICVKPVCGGLDGAVDVFVQPSAAP